MYFATFLCFLLAAVWRPGRGDGTFPREGLERPMFQRIADRNTY